MVGSTVLGCVGTHTDCCIFTAWVLGQKRRAWKDCSWIYETLNDLLEDQLIT